MKHQVKEEGKDLIIGLSVAVFLEEGVKGKLLIQMGLIRISDKML